MRWCIAFSGFCGTAFVLQAQPIDLQAGLPSFGAHSIAHHYLPDWQGEHLPVGGTHWSWALDSVNWIFHGEAADTVWHHSASRSPQQGGNFSVYEHYYLTYRFHHLRADTLVEDSAWVTSQGTTEVRHPSVPLCWQGQALGDSVVWHDLVSGVDRSTRYRATLDLRTPWGVLPGLVVFEDRILDQITYRIHRREDLVRELARYHVLDGLYLNWPMASP